MNHDVVCAFTLLDMLILEHHRKDLLSLMKVDFKLILIFGNDLTEMRKTLI